MLSVCRKIFTVKKKIFTKSMDNTQNWYIVKRSAGNCEIVSSDQVEEDNPEIIEQWGPFSSQEEAIARRVGLIRSSKCQPV
jgi:hypothetical protein